MRTSLLNKQLKEKDKLIEASESKNKKEKSNVEEGSNKKINEIAGKLLESQFIWFCIA